MGWGSGTEVQDGRDICIHIADFLVAQMIKNLLTMWETQVQSLGQEGLPGEGNSYPLQHSCLENSIDRRTWWAIVHGVTKSWT